MLRWYLRFKLSFRDLAEMMAERNLSMAHTTIMRWVHRYAPEFERAGTNSLGRLGNRGASMRVCRSKRRKRWGRPPQLAYRSRLETTVSGVGQKRGS